MKSNYKARSGEVTVASHDPDSAAALGGDDDSEATALGSPTPPPAAQSKTCNENATEVHSYAPQLSSAKAQMDAL